MRTASTVLLLVAAALVGFAYWETETAAGRRAYDEMDGIIPFGAGLLGVGLALFALVVWWVGNRRRR